MNSNKVYRAISDERGGLYVTVNGAPLNPRHDIANYNVRYPHLIFQSGRMGGATAQLAIAILADYLGKIDDVRELHGKFAWLVLNELSTLPWEIDSGEMERHLQLLRAK